MDTYSVKDAAALTGISKQALRIYTQRYSRWLSTEATPPPGQPRTFTADDLRLLHFVYSLTGSGQTHDQVIARLTAGELDSYPWHAPQAPAEAPAEESTAVMPPDQLRVFVAMLDEYKQRERESAEREADLRERLERLQFELGEARGRLAEHTTSRWRPPAWFTAIFGSHE